MMFTETKFYETEVGGTYEFTYKIRPHTYVVYTVLRYINEGPKVCRFAILIVCSSEKAWEERKIYYISEHDVLSSWDKRLQ